MPLEIERKFLIAGIPKDLERYKNEQILQGYLFISEDIEIRLRKKGDIYFQTIKSGSGMKRNETEINLTKEQFKSLWPLTEGKRLEKVRYEIIYKDLNIELDLYKGSLEKLITAEVEFYSEIESNNFTPPTWFGPEVTNDSRYKNKNLALFGTPD